MITNLDLSAGGILFLLLLAVSVAAAWAALPQAGQQAPSFSLTNQDGKQVALSNFSGKWVVLYFYPKDFTSGCTIEAHNFQHDLDSYTKANAVILGVSVDDVNSHRGFCDKEGLKFDLLADVEGKVSGLYGSLREQQGNAMSARNTFIINPSGKIAKVFEAVQPAVHSEQVLAALAQLQGNK
jgi:thioredoxin-dependent peroxiredoxin